MLFTLASAQIASSTATMLERACSSALRKAFCERSSGEVPLKTSCLASHHKRHISLASVYFRTAHNAKLMFIFAFNALPERSL